jgi:hypothetical protein
MPRLSPMDLKALRWSVRPEHVGAPDETLERTVYSVIPGLSDSTAKRKALGSIGQAVRPTLQRAAPCVVQGATVCALGNQQILSASGTSAPRGANGLLTRLLANASEGLAHAESISEPSYLRSDGSGYLIDLAFPEQQAAPVLSRVESVSSTRFRSGSGGLCGCSGVDGGGGVDD